MIAAIAGAVRLETVAPDRARRLWAAADRRLVDEAAGCRWSMRSRST